MVPCRAPLTLGSLSEPPLHHGPMQSPLLTLGSLSEPPLHHGPLQSPLLILGSLAESPLHKSPPPHIHQEPLTLDSPSKYHIHRGPQSPLTSWSLTEHPLTLRSPLHKSPPRHHSPLVHTWGGGKSEHNRQSLLALIINVHIKDTPLTR